MKVYGLIGYPLGHSFSKGYFSHQFEAAGMDAQYLNFEISSIAQVENVLQENPQLAGLNVTIPYKEAIIPYLDALSPEASAVGAVNVVQIKYEQGKRLLIGHNTDIIGFQEALMPSLLPQHSKALVLGTGGASKAVVYVLKKLGISYLLVSRNPQSSLEISYQDASSLLNEYLLLINSTPVGTFPNIDTYPLLDYSKLSPQHYLFDLVYNPPETAFLRFGTLHGASTMNGKDMLHIQAEAAWDIWNLC